ncbi:MAG: dienelactone hydrolase family protein [Gemmatimonadaceae bacterium]|nr:dienelactone hydrolase family protein [Chitinophagaceae bacterium]
MKNYPVPMLSILTSIIILFSACKKDTTAPGNPADAVPETKSAIQVAVNANVNSNIGGFYRALPARYDSTTKKYPLMIFIHGVGELGNGTSDLSKVLNNGVPNLLSQKKFPPSFTVNGKDFSFIVVSPQFKAWPQAPDVNAMINYAIANYRVDTTRIYVAGLSMGGGATWEYAVDNSSRIAAIVPICGAGWMNDAQATKIAATNLPIWTFHNDDDGTVSANTTRMIVNLINAHNPNPAAKSTFWPTGGHNSWTKATNPATRECNGMNMYEWMLQYERNTK